MRLNKKVKPIAELLYWIVVLFFFGVSGALYSRASPQPAIDYHHMSSAKLVSTAFFASLGSGFLIWLFSLLQREIMEKLFD